MSAQCHGRTVASNVAEKEAMTIPAAMGPAWGVPWACMGHAMVLYGACHGPAWGVPWACMGRAMGLHGACCM